MMWIQKSEQSGTPTSYSNCTKRIRIKYYCFRWDLILVPNPFHTFFQVEKKTLLNFAENIISHQGDSIKSRLDNLHALVVPEEGGGILGNYGVLSMFANGIKV